MCDGALSEILETQPYFVRRFANLAYCLQSGGIQRVSNSRGELNIFDQGIVRQIWRWIEHGLFPLRLQPQIKAVTDPDPTQLACAVSGVWSFRCEEPQRIP